MTKTEQVLQLARRVVELEGELAAARRSLNALVEGGEPSQKAEVPSKRHRVTATSRSTAAADGGDVQAVVLRLVLGEPARKFRAGDLRALLPGRPGKNSIESSLQRLMRAGQIERCGRGLYQAPR